LSAHTSLLPSPVYRHPSNIFLPQKLPKT
jgi:hypothetical protein